MGDPQNYVLVSDDEEGSGTDTGSIELAPLAREETQQDRRWSADSTTYPFERQEQVTEQNDKLTRLTWWQLVLVTIPLLGCQFSWAVQSGLSSPHLRRLGVSQENVALAWLAGPISGMVVQPLVGLWSDKTTTRWGRRRPFMAGGLGTIVAGLLLFSFADGVGHSFGEDTLQCTGGHCPISVAVAVTAFFILDFSINFVMGPSRALFTDIVPPRQQRSANAFYSFMAGAGNLLGALAAAGGTRLVNLIPSLATPIRGVYIITAIVVVLTVGACVVLVKEKSPSAITPSQPSTKGNKARRGWGRMWAPSIPKDFVHVFLVQCTAWYSWFTLFIYATDWMGQTLFGGNPNPSSGAAHGPYVAGVEFGSMSLAVQSVVGIVVSLFLPRLLRNVGVTKMYMVTQVLLSLLLLCMYLISLLPGGSSREPVQAGGFISLVLLGVPWACTVAIPWAITGVAISHSQHKGTLNAIMNLSQCLPEFVASFVGTIILRFAGQGNSHWVFLPASLSALFGCFLVGFLQVGKTLEHLHPSTEDLQLMVQSAEALHP